MATLPAADQEGSSMETPEWLAVLENRIKKRHELAHDIGAGSPCLLCKEKCRGLNLHFWRKICIECKCRKEDHDFVYGEEYAQFEILFGAKSVKRTTLKYNKGGMTFDWIPQNASPELVIDYFNAIPQSKLPITNSEGANHRKQQLERQLPIHDVNPNACHNLSDKEISKFEEYMKNLRENVIGQGKIMRYNESHFFKDGYGPCSISNIPRQGPDNGKPYTIGIGGNLVVAKPDIRKSISEKLEVETNSAKFFATTAFHCNEVKSGSLSNYKKLKQPNRFLENLSVNANKEDTSGSYSDISRKLKELCIGNSSPTPYISHRATREYINGNPIKSEDGSVEMKMTTPFSYVGNLDNENNNDFIRSNDATYDTIGKLNSDSLLHNGVCSFAGFQPNIFENKRSTSNNPVAYKKEPVEINIMNASNQESPFIPVQETNIYRDKGVVEDGVLFQDTSQPLKASYNDYLRCLQCREVFVANDVVVKTDRGGDGNLWHAKCFVCDICKELLVDLMYFYFGGKVYCGRDYAKIRNIPRCFACDELIFINEYTQAEGQSFHVKHFCCYLCDTPLGGKQYISKDDQPLCLECYQTHYGKTCLTCCKIIPVSEQRISFGELHYHLRPECFRCEQCSKFLLEEKFLVKNGKTFCTKECFQQFTIL